MLSVGAYFVWVRLQDHCEVFLYRGFVVSPSLAAFLALVPAGGTTAGENAVNLGFNLNPAVVCKVEVIGVAV